MNPSPIPQLIFSIARKMKADAEKNFAGREITLLQFAVLKNIADGCRTQNEIARKLVIKAPSLVPSVDSLAKAALIERRADAKDRRRVTLLTTKKGEALLKKTPAPFSPNFRKALRGLGEHKEKELSELLSELLKKI